MLNHRLIRRRHVEAVRVGGKGTHSFEVDQGGGRDCAVSGRVVGNTETIEWGHVACYEAVAERSCLATCFGAKEMGTVESCGNTSAVVIAAADARRRRGAVSC